MVTAGMLFHGEGKAGGWRLCEATCPGSSGSWTVGLCSSLHCGVKDQLELNGKWGDASERARNMEMNRASLSNLNVQSGVHDNETNGRFME